MIKPHEIRTDINGRDLRLILEKNNLTQFIQNGEIIESMDWSHVVFQKMGLRPEFLKTAASALKELTHFLKKIGHGNPEFERFIDDLDEILEGFDKHWNHDAVKALESYFMDDDKMEAFYATVENACFLMFLKKHMHEYGDNIIAGLVSFLFKKCESWKGKQFAWMYTREELMQCTTITLNNSNPKDKPSMQMGEKVMEALLEEQSMLDSVVFAILPLLTISERRLRRDIHNWIQSGLEVLFSDKLMKFEQAWSYYFKEDSPKREVNRHVYALLQNYYGMPEDWKAYETVSGEKGASKREFNDYIYKSIMRCFAGRVRQNK